MKGHVMKIVKIIMVLMLLHVQTWIYSMTGSNLLSQEYGLTGLTAQLADTSDPKKFLEQGNGSNGLFEEPEQPTKIPQQTVTQLAQVLPMCGKGKKTIPGEQFHHHIAEKRKLNAVQPTNSKSFDRDWGCLVCKKKFIHPSNLSEHVKHDDHTIAIKALLSDPSEQKKLDKLAQGTANSCPACYIFFQKPTGLNMHKRLRHKKNSDDTSPETTKETDSLSNDSYEDPHNDKLSEEDVEEEEEEEEPVERTSKKSKTTLAATIHTLRNPYFGCLVCHQTFDEPESLQIHVKKSETHKDSLAALTLERSKKLTNLAHNMLHCCKNGCLVYFTSQQGIDQHNDKQHAQ